MASIDERVVAMSFENAKFEAGVATTMRTLSRLETALGNMGKDASFARIEAESHKVTLQGPMNAIQTLKARLGSISSGATFAEIEAAADRVHFGGIISAVEKVKSKLSFPEAKNAFAELDAADEKVNFDHIDKEIEETAGHFSVLSTAAGVAIGNIMSSMTMGVSRGLKAALGAVKDGFSDYELKIAATQTIMSGTGENIGTVTDNLKELDKYADRTIYNLRDMTGNIGKFTNAGVKLPIAVKAMEGIANLAALSGADANEAARAMYNLGQAIGQGKVRMADWRSVELANMGTKEFKEQLIDAALAMGTLKKGNDGVVRSLKGNEVNFKTFGSTLEDNWLTAEALTKTLNKYSDETTNLGKRAFAAATDVKTFTMMLETVSAAAGTGWTDTFDIILGNLPEATKMWTDLTNTIGGFIGKSTEMRNKVLADWKELGGRTLLIDGIKTAFHNVLEILKPIGEAFREIFPRKTGQDLFNMTKAFFELAESLKPTPALVDAVKRIFGGLFATAHIVWVVLKDVVGVIFDLFGAATEGSGGFMQFLASVGDFMVAVDDAVTKGGALKGLFETISTVLQVPLELIKELAGALGEMFLGADPQKAEGVADAMDTLNEKLKPLRHVMDDVVEGWHKFVDILDKFKTLVEPGVNNLLDYLGQLGTFLADKFKNMNWNDAVDAIQTGLIAGVFLKLKQAISGGLNIDFGGGMIKNLSSALGALTDNLKAMQRGIQVTTLLEIAVAIGILAAGIYTLSKIPADKLTKSMTAISVGLAQLVGAVYLLTIASKGGLGFKIGAIAASMILLAAAVTILAVAMRIMAKLSWEEIGRGLVGVAGSLLAVSTATQLLNGPKILAAGLAMIPLAAGLVLIATAMKIFASLKPKELGLGLMGVMMSLLAIAAAMTIMPPNLLITAAGVTVLAAGLVVLSTAVAMFGSMDMKTLAKGILGIATALMLIAGAMILFPPTLPLTAAGLILVAVALNGIASAIAIMGNLNLGTLVKGIVAMTVVLNLLASSLYLMAGTLPGAAALLAAAAALAILGPALGFLGQLKWTTILKGLVAMGAALAILAVAGALASGPLIALGLALAAIGGGMLVISAALSLFVLALAQLGSKGPKAIAAMVAAFGAFLLVLPKLIIDFIKGLVVIVAEIVKIAPEIAKGLVSIAGTLLDAIISLSPKIAEAISALVVLIAQVMTENIPKLVEAGFKLLEGLLTGIRNHMPKLMDTATDIVARFIEGLGRNAPKLVNAGVNALTNFLHGITIKIPNVLPVVGKMITTFIDGVTKQLPKIIRSGANLIVRFLEQIALAVPRFVRAGVNIIIGFLSGIQEAIPRLVKKGLSVARSFLNAVADGLAELADIGFKAIIRFLHGLERAIRENSDDLANAGAGVADAIIDAMVDQFGKLGGILRSALEKVFGLLPHWAKKILGIASPSKVFMEIGRLTMEGFIQGVEDADMKSPMETAANNAVRAANDAFSSVPDLLEGIVDMEPVITPVLDLTQVEKDARGLADMTNVTPITAAASYSQAASISAGQQQAAADAQAAAAGNQFNYTQNNYSPESLSDVEIYRQTKNQLSTVKRGLGLAS